MSDGPGAGFGIHQVSNKGPSGLKSSVLPLDQAHRGPNRGRKLSSLR